MATDPEVDQLRAAVSCAVVLERAGYKLDERESSQKSLKYRRGSGETVIVNHDGKGWWDTGSQAKGDVFTLAQHLDPSLNFGQVRRELRQLVGMAPAFPPAERAPRERAETLPPELRWTARKPVRGKFRIRVKSGHKPYPAAEVSVPTRIVLAIGKIAACLRTSSATRCRVQTSTPSI